MADCNLFVGDSGTNIRATIVECESGTAIDVSSATGMQITFYKPTALDPAIKENVVKTCIFDSDGVDGKILYKIESGFLDVKGTYKFQARVTLPSGVWNTTKDSFIVKDNL